MPVYRYEHVRDRAIRCEAMLQAKINIKCRLRNQGVRLCYIPAPAITEAARNMLLTESWWRIIAEAILIHEGLIAPKTETP